MGIPTHQGPAVWYLITSSSSIIIYQHLDRVIPSLVLVSFLFPLPFYPYQFTSSASG